MSSETFCDTKLKVPVALVAEGRDRDDADHDDQGQHDGVFDGRRAIFTLEEIHHAAGQIFHGQVLRYESGGVAGLNSRIAVSCQPRQCDFAEYLDHPPQAVQTDRSRFSRTLGESCWADKLHSGRAPGHRYFTTSHKDGLGMSEPPTRTSLTTTGGLGRAPNRAMLRGVGFSDDDFDKPMIGVANLQSDITPCNAHLDRLAQRAREGIRAAGGVPQVFGARPRPTAS